MRFSIDLDGVLARFDEAFVFQARKLYPNLMPPIDKVELDDWDWPDKYIGKQGTKEVWKQIKATPDFWIGLSPYADNLHDLALFLAAAKRHDIYFLTSRAKTVGMTVAQQSERWLRLCGLNFNLNYLGILAVDDPLEKPHVVTSLSIAMHIDDHAETIQALDKLKSHEAYLLDRPWNQNFKTKHRVKSLGEYLDQTKKEINWSGV